MSSLNVLINSRKYARASVTRIYNDRDNFGYLNALSKQNTLIKVQELIEHLKTIDKDILDLKFNNDNCDEEEFKKEMESSEKYRDRCTECLCLLATPVAQETADVSGGPGRSYLKSPTAPLPEFNSLDGENLDLFFKNFDDTICKYNYAEYDKFLLLKQQIKGKASLLIESLDPSNHTYVEARNLLMSAFATSAMQKFNVIKQLSDMKLGYNDEPFQYISDMKKIQQSVAKLNITIEDVMQFFFFTGFNESFRTQMIQITNSVRPTLAEMNDNFFKANERYQVAQNLYKNRRSSSDKNRNNNNIGTHSSSNSFAVSAEGRSGSKPSIGNKYNPFVNCTLCSEDGSDVDHQINKCNKYLAPIDKINRLNELQGCIKCAHLDHVFSKCKFRFNRKCSNCSDWHFVFLCHKVKDDQSSGTRTTSYSNSMIYNNNSFHGSINVNSVLPTFVCNSVSGVKIRCLRDTGSQSNLVAESVLNKIDHEILSDNIDLDLNGINNSKVYKSKLVKMKLKFGHEYKTIEALSIPNINIFLKLPGLSRVAGHFIKMGYKLADEFLLGGRDSIDNLDLIIGSNSAYCFIEKTIPFGTSGTCVFSLSQMGVMLLGDINPLLNCINDLPPAGSVDAGAIRISSSVNCSAVNIGFKLSSCGYASQSKLSIDKNIPNDHSEFSDKIDLALEESLDEQCNFHLHKSEVPSDEMDSELNNKLVAYLLDNTERKEDGRLVMPLLWNGRVSHLLAHNLNLAKSVLESNKLKLIKSNNIELVDGSIKELLSKGFVERISNLNEYIVQFPNYSFLAHMPVIKLQRESTKCRVVYLSNLCETSKKNSNAISHNQAMFSGPCLNQKLTTSLLLLRFDEKLLCFDLKKAFLQIELSELDQSKLLFFWFKDPINNDYTLQAYKNVRLSFGLRCSPTILMVGLYKILIIDTENDSPRLKELKRLIYALIYMDNGAITASSSEDLLWAFEQLSFIFNPYKFYLQQFCSNDFDMELKITATQSEGESKECSNSSVELFGLLWDKSKDSLTTKKKILNPDANTKRLILKSIAENFDPYNYDGPIINRARLFMHELQLQNDLGWDKVLSSEQLNVWHNIAKQVNSAQTITVPRFVGKRCSSYKLLAFVDSSKVIYGATIFIIEESTNKVSFLLAKNRIIGKNLQGKSIPSLELLSIVLGVEILSELKQDLSGPLCLKPINITELIVYSDSLVALSWVKSYFVSLSKMNKHSIYIMNRLETIKKISDKFPVQFKFVEGLSNPADCITRPLSYKSLIKTNYITGPDFLNLHPDNMAAESLFSFKVPHFSGPPVHDVGGLNNSSFTLFSSPQHLIKVSKYSSIDKFIKVYMRVFLFINKLKARIGIGSIVDISDLKNIALRYLIDVEQRVCFSEIHNYYSLSEPKHREMPQIIRQLNVFKDKEGILRVGSKMLKNKSHFNNHCPILLPKSSLLTDLIVRKLHQNLNHAGVYSCLAALRKEYWIPNNFSVVKKLLKNCVHCKRFNQRTVKLNQSPYREFRLHPNNIPFSNVFLDYIGPFFVNLGKEKEKVWVLCITCLYTRAVNLKVTLNMTTEEFLRSFNLHTFEYGVPQLVFSDLGSNLVAGANMVSEILNDAEVFSYFKENNASITKFEHYYKGHSELGSIVESLVKITKRLIFGSIKNNVIPLREFEYLIAEVINLANKRPIALMETLRDSSLAVPEVITPELLIHGYDLLTINLMPQLQKSPEDPDWLSDGQNQRAPCMKDAYYKLRAIRENLLKIYNEEFVVKLINQATDKNSRYKPVRHKKLNIGDVVLLKEENCKPSKYPMGVVKELQINCLDETTGAIILKGNGENVKRHASAIIPLLTVHEDNFFPSQDNNVDEQSKLSEPNGKKKVQRQAALDSREKTLKILTNL